MKVYFKLQIVLAAIILVISLWGFFSLKQSNIDDSRYKLAKNLKIHAQTVKSFADVYKQSAPAILDIHKNFLHIANGLEKTSKFSVGNIKKELLSLSLKLKETSTLVENYKNHVDPKLQKSLEETIQLLNDGSNNIEEDTTLTIVSYLLLLLGVAISTVIFINATVLRKIITKLETQKL